MSTLSDVCRDATVSISVVEDILDKIETDEFNPHGAIDDVDKFGETAIRWASSNGRNDIISLLIERKANINCFNDLQQTPLHAACWNNNLDCCSTLLKEGAEIEIKDRDGCTALHKVSIKI